MCFVYVSWSTYGSLGTSSGLVDVEYTYEEGTGYRNKVEKMEKFK